MHREQACFCRQFHTAGEYEVSAANIQRISINESLNEFLQLNTQE